MQKQEQQQKQQPGRKQDDEISLKELFLKLKEWWNYLWGSWKLLLLAGIVGAVIGIAWSLISKPNYTARLSFVLEEDEGANPLGAYMGLASQFGFDLGGGQSGVFSGANIIQLLQSRLMIERALLSVEDTAGKEQTLAGDYIELNKLRKKWDDDPLLVNISFPVGFERSGFSLQQDSILKEIYLAIKEDHLEVEKPDKESGIIEVNCTFKDQKFSQQFTERLVNEVTEFYIQTKTKRSRDNIGKLQTKADSIETLLNKKTYSLASTQDMNINPARMSASVPVELAARDKTILQTVYGEVVKNLEMSKLALLRETPLIQVIDRPILPLEKNHMGIIKGILIGGFLGGFLMFIILLVRKIYREIMGL